MTRTVAPPVASRMAVAGSPLARLGTVLISHPVIDAYAGFVPPLLGVLQVRCDLSDWQKASLLSLGPLVSGLCQPLFAWVSDHMDSRIFGPLGLVFAAACMSSIGLARDFPSLVVLFTVGLLGVGAFHPIAAATMGQLSGTRRSLGVTLFFAAGMVGATVGPIISTRLTAIEPNGFDLLRWVMIPGVLVALVLHAAIRHVPHRHHEHRTVRFEPRDLRSRWVSVVLLFLGNAMRYSINIALLYLFVQWAELFVAGNRPEASPELIARLGSLYCGELNALMFLGMGIGGLGAGLLVRQGREKWSLVLVPLLLAPAIAAFPYTGRWGSYGLALLAGVGFAAVMPLTISLAQRLLPHRTSFASSLAMGGAWAVAVVAPPLSELGLQRLGIVPVFVITAAVLAVSGLISLPLSTGLLHRVAGTTPPQAD